MGKHTAAWKAHEKRTAAALGGQRLGATGAANPDVLTTWLAVECKHRAKRPDWMTAALSKIRAQAGQDRLGIVVLHQAGARDSVVMLSLQDFRDWFGEVKGMTQPDTVGELTEAERQCAAESWDDPANIFEIVSPSWLLDSDHDEG